MSGLLKTHEIHAAALARVGRTHADVLTECLFWSQYAQHDIGGVRAFWKTGRELSTKLGMSPRTASAHLKFLERQGWWKIRYRSRPGHPSPVTWLILSDDAMQLMQNLSSAKKPKSPRAHKKRGVQGQNGEPATAKAATLQASQKATPKQISQADETTGQKKGFFLSKEQKMQEMNEAFFSEVQEGCHKDIGKEGALIKAPKWMKASNSHMEFLTDVQETLKEFEMPVWDALSKYTWRDIAEIEKKMEKAGIVGRSARRAFVMTIVESWDDFRDSMEYRYSSHDTNRDRPSPMALAHEFQNLLDHQKQFAIPLKPKGGPSSLDDGIFD